MTPENINIEKTANGMPYVILDIERPIKARRNVNKAGGNEDDARLVPELAFDPATCPMLFIHGDADGYAAMNSVKCWEQLRRMGIQSDLHTLATRGHCFQRKAAPGTGSYTWMDRIWEFMNHKDFNR